VHNFSNGDGKETNPNAHLIFDLNEFKTKSRIGTKGLRG